MKSKAAKSPVSGPSAATQKLISRINSAQKSAEAAKKQAKSAKQDLKLAKKRWKEAKRTAKVRRKELKALEAALVAQEKKPKPRVGIRKNAAVPAQPLSSPSAEQVAPQVPVSVVENEGTTAEKQ